MKNNETGELIPWLVLLKAHGLGPSKTNALLQHYGTAQSIINASAKELATFGLSNKTISALHNTSADTFQADIDWQNENNHHIITYSDERYPKPLRNISDPPPLLYVWGDPDYLNQPQLAIVGSRTPTAIGKKTAYDFSSHLAKAGITITSGLAKGIDGACHNGALEGLAGTVALVAHGLDIIYPAEHRSLAEAISANGAVVSECSIGTEPHRGLFPKRNRIISGMSFGTLVVEAALRSGSLITAKLALEQGREVFAIPGSIHNPLARGCHQLIRQGAKLVETADDILEELSPYLSAPKISPTINQPIDKKTVNPQPRLDPDHQKLLKCLAYDPLSVDEIVNQSGFSAAEVASMLLIMELEGNVVSQSGLYTRAQ